MQPLVDPLLSVIIPCRDHAPYLDECIDSVLSQNYGQLEVVICDDASRDGSWETLEVLQRRYPKTIRLIRNQQPQGPSRARHQAILASHGAYLATLDSDDYYIDRHKLEAEMDLIRSRPGKRPSDVIAFSNIVWVDRDGNRLGVWGKAETLLEGDLLCAILGRSHMIPRDFVMNRESYFEVGGYDPDLTHYEDWDLKIRLARRCRFYYTGLAGTAYRQLGSGLSSIPISEHIERMQLVFDRYISWIADETVQKDVVNRFGVYKAGLMIRNG